MNPTPREGLRLQGTQSDPVEAEETKHLRNQIDALKRGSAKLGLALLAR